jgi:hypothetical protein
MMGHEMIFVMQGGAHEGYFKCLVMRKNCSILYWPQVWGGNQCLVIGNWIAH